APAPSASAPISPPPAATASPAAAPDAGSPLGAKVRLIFEQNCFRCHGQDGDTEGGVNVLDRDKLVSGKKVTPGDPQTSRLFKRPPRAPNPMPPEDESPRPSADDVELVKQWIAAGAPPFAEAAAAAKPIDVRSMLTAIRDHLLKAPEQDRRFLRYFT